MADESTPAKGNTLGKRVVAALVFVLAIWILLQLVVDLLGGIVSSILWCAVIAVLVGAIIWSLRRLR